MRAASGDRVQAMDTSSELELKILLVGAPKSVGAQAVPLENIFVHSSSSTAAQI